jgi:hypothetical protein
MQPSSNLHNNQKVIIELANDIKRLNLRLVHLRHEKSKSNNPLLVTKSISNTLVEIRKTSLALSQQILGR